MISMEDSNVYANPPVIPDGTRLSPGTASREPYVAAIKEA
jgi:hypothetical protein